MRQKTDFRCPETHLPVSGKARFPWVLRRAAFLFNISPAAIVRHAAGTDNIVTFTTANHTSKTISR